MNVVFLLTRNQGLRQVFFTESRYLQAYRNTPDMSLYICSSESNARAKGEGP